ncbi:MAG TPA: DUF2914 domain-containing protein, partial [Syntrophobacteraceae bacterium]|nr:DUF2914 domain-containing protein [Syntrophobacteraceae bacterium]
QVPSGTLRATGPRGQPAFSFFVPIRQGHGGVIEMKPPQSNEGCPVSGRSHTAFAPLPEKAIRRTGLGRLLLIVALLPAMLATIAPLSILAQATAPAGSPQPAQPSEASHKIKLTEASMCERVENLAPIRPGMVFSVSNGQVCCFTSFDPVPQATLVYHRWFHREELSTQIKLRIYPPKWSTYSVIQLRDTDKGPWRVEITDQNGRVLTVLRFSIAD